MAAGNVAHAERVARLVLRSLEQGRCVEIERLGAFRPGKDGRVVFVPDRRPSVFLAYANEDAASVDRIYAALAEAGFDPWMDRRKLLAGQNWPRAIEGAIETSDFFLACLSRRALVKRGIFQSEMRYALDCARRAPLDDIYFIPVRLQECDVPARIRSHIQYVDLFPDFDAGMRHLIEVIREEMRRRDAR